MGRLRRFECPACGYESSFVGDGPGMLSAREVFRCDGCRDLVSLTTRLMGEETTPDEREMEHALGGCALPDLAMTNGGSIPCPCCDAELHVAAIGMWD